MSQPDLVAQLHAARLEAPAPLRARVRLIAAAAEKTPRGRVTWRRALVVAVPVAAAVVAGVLLTRPSSERRSVPLAREGAASRSAVAPSLTKPAPVPTPEPLTVPRAAGRAQIYDATLSLELQTSAAVSDGVKRALRITSSLGGYPRSVHAGTRGRQATADLVLKIPRAHVQQALARLAELGTITREHVDVQDAQAGLNATDRTIARLQRQLKTLRAEEPPPAARIAALEARIVALQRREAAVRRTAHYATVSLRLATPRPPAPPASHGHGPLHGVGVALTWLGIGALYALAIGGPVVLLGLAVFFAVRFVRRRREDELLSRS